MCAYVCACVRACVQFNLLMALRGLQPEVLMIIFCEVVVMVWPQQQWPFCCLHTVLDQFGGVCTLQRR